MTEMPEPAPKRPRFFYGWVIVATMFAVNFSTMATGTLNYGLFVLPMQNELGLSRATFGWMQTTRRLSTAALSFAVGWLIDRYGARVYIPVAALLIGGCLILVGMSSHAWQFIALFALVGVSGLAAPNGLVTSVPVAKWFVRKRGRALALSTAGLGISGIVFLPVTQWLIDGYGWRSSWQILALLFMVISIPASALFLRRQPEDVGLRVDGDPPDAPADDAPLSEPRRSTDDEPVWTVRQAFRTATMWKLMAVFALAGVAQGGASFHRIPYFVEKAYDPLLVSWSFAADAGGAAALALVSGWLADRIPIRFPGRGLVFGIHHRHPADDLRSVGGDDVPVHHRIRLLRGRRHDCAYVHFRGLLRPGLPGHDTGHSDARQPAERRAGRAAGGLPARLRGVVPAGLVDAAGHLRRLLRAHAHGPAAPPDQRRDATMTPQSAPAQRGNDMAKQPDPAHSYPPNPIADAAWEIYETELREKLESEHHGKLVFIDAKSHDYEIEDEHGGAWVHLTDRHPDAVCYAYRIGYPNLVDARGASRR